MAGGSHEYYNSFSYLGCLVETFARVSHFFVLFFFSCSCVISVALLENYQYLVPTSDAVLGNLARVTSAMAAARPRSRIMLQLSIIGITRIFIDSFVPVIVAPFIRPLTWIDAYFAK